MSLNFGLPNIFPWLDWGSNSEPAEILPPRGHLAMSGDVFGYNKAGGSGGGDSTGISWGEATDAVKHPTILGTVPHNCLTQNVHGVKVKRLWIEGIFFL